MPPRSISQLTKRLNDSVCKEMKDLEAVETRKYEQTAPHELQSLLQNAKMENQELVGSTVNQLSHVMGKMTSYSAERSMTRLRPYKPDVIFSEKHQLRVRPLEARFLRIPLEVKSDGYEKATTSAQAPLIIYFAKDTNYMCDTARAKLTSSRTVDPDLKVYISRKDGCPSASNCDIMYDFTDPGNDL